MQILCGFCLLLAFHFFLRWIETGRRRYYLLQWAVFLAGFLVMETNVMYPALAASYTVLCARKYFRATLPLFGASAIYAGAAHGAHPQGRRRPLCHAPGRLHPDDLRGLLAPGLLALPPARAHRPARVAGRCRARRRDPRP